MTPASFYGYYAGHGGFSNYKNGFEGMKYNKKRKAEYVEQQALVHNNGVISDNKAKDMSGQYGTTPITELVNENYIGTGKSNEEMRLNSTAGPNVEFTLDASHGSNVSMQISRDKPRAKSALRQDDSVKLVNFRG